MPFNLQGLHGNGHFLKELMQKKRVEVMVEVGSWTGLSTQDIASLLPKEGTVYAIDTWNGSPAELDLKFKLRLNREVSSFLPGKLFGPVEGYKVIAATQ